MPEPAPVPSSLSHARSGSDDRMDTIQQLETDRERGLGLGDWLLCAHKDAFLSDQPKRKRKERFEMHIVSQAFRRIRLD